MTEQKQDPAALDRWRLLRGPEACADFLAGGGEMGARMRAHDWAATGLGPPEGWPPPLRTAVRLMLNTGHPMYIWWGPELLCLYNDAYRRSIGPERHPGSLGRPGREVWAEIWPIIGPQIEQVMRGEGATWHENQLVPITRHGRLEEVYWTYSYSPIDEERAPNGVGGVLVVCTETTEAVRERARQAFALALSERLRDQSDPERMMEAACATLGEGLHVAQVGFAELEADREHVVVRRDWNDGRLKSAVGRWRMEDFGREFAQAMRSGATIAIPDVAVDERTNAPAVLSVFAGVGARAFLDVPLMREEQQVAMLFVNHPVPRVWTSDELKLAEETVRRLWDAVERARAETRLRRSEAELIRLNEELEQRVRQEVAAREEVQARLSHAQRMEALGQLAGGIAHDFNNVLQSVGGGARLIEAKPDDPERVRRIAGLMSDAAARGSAITSRLLTFSRRAELRVEPVEAAELLAGVQEVLSHTLGAGLRVEVKAGDALPLFLTDKRQLETVFINLAANARDAMDGQGAITLTAEAVRVGERGESQPFASLSPGQFVRLSVIDTGCGMSPEVLARASEPFFTTKPRGKGTGLGLAMARGVAEQSGGALRIESAPGRGTTVSLWFRAGGDAAPNDTMREAAAEPPQGPHDGRARVLLVDDEAAVREILAEQLLQAGYDVRAAASATEALALLSSGWPADVLIADLSMPDIDGLALVAEAQRRRPRLPAIVLTGFATDAAEITMRGAVSGSFSLLRKPIEGVALAEHVAALLAGVEGSARRD